MYKINMVHQESMQVLQRANHVEKKFQILEDNVNRIEIKFGGIDESLQKKIAKFE